MTQQSTEANADIATMSDEDLMSEWTRLGEDVGLAKERLKAFSAEHQRRTRKADLAQFADMSDEDMALLQEARAEGIESQEGVGEL